MIRTNDVGAKAIRFVYESRQIERENNALLKEELVLCDSQIVILTNDLVISKEVMKSKDQRISYIEESQNLYINETKRLKRRLLFSNAREVLLGLIGAASIGYGIYITIDR
jgi:hypothetical protein